MSKTVSPNARSLAVRISRAFDQDRQYAVALNDAQQRLTVANGDLWSGVHPEALALLYDDTHAAGIDDRGNVGSKITAVMADALSESSSQDDRERYAAVETAALKAVQEIHWTIHRAFVEYQRVAEDRRQLAADIGELVAKLVDAVGTTGWTETEAREVNIHELAEPQSS